MNVFEQYNVSHPINSRATRRCKHCISRSLVAVMLLTLLASARLLAADEAPYQLDRSFPQLPEGLRLGAVSGVAIDRNDHVLVFDRGEPPILVFDARGNFKGAFGRGLFTSPHGLRVDPEGNVWVTDNANHTVLKLDPTGKVLLTLGTKNESGTDERHFNKPTDVAFARNGDFYVSDGYGNSRVVKFDKDGRFILAWGRKGSGDGEFNLPHAVRVDSKDQVYVADRENNRIQVFDSKGKFLRKIEGIAPFGLEIARDDTLYVADGRANVIVKMRADGTVLARWGGTGRGPGQFDMAHGIAVDSAGAVYACDINGRRIQRFVPAGRR